MSKAGAQEEFRKLLVERSENRLRHIGQCPKFSDYLEQTGVHKITYKMAYKVRK